MWAANLATGFQIRFALRNGQEESAEVHYFNGGEPNLIAIRVSSNLLSQVILTVGRISYLLTSNYVRNGMGCVCSHKQPNAFA
jgi:hypothetical protein